MNRPQKKVAFLFAVFLGAVLASAAIGAPSPPEKQAEEASPFPTRGILPKTETGALRFLAEHPDDDGRGVVVAIFDTGVDPGAAGLQTTSDGKPKLLDMIDATGSGDVDTSTIRHAEEDHLQGLSGRTLSISPDWKNPSEEYHVGLKRAYDFFPDSLVVRLKHHRRDVWNRRQRELEAALRQRLDDFETQHSPPTADEKQTRDELRARLELLEALPSKYDDPGPLYDCVVFHDGTRWQAVVDTDEDGDLKDESLLANFRHLREYATFDEESLLNFAVNIYDDGNVLSIVTDAGPHGTHVACIVAGNFPAEPELSGLAPGAQLVSIKIGDSRLGGMETGAALVRALIAARDHHCDLINMSYGEPTTRPNRGWITDLFTEIVRQQHVLFVASAGNAGPALSTVGAPGGTTSAVLGVGAYLSPEMMRVAYSLRETLLPMPYSWTSRGPTLDGDLGVDIFAPGGAISPVPRWTLNRELLMNGTSMASPNACGSIALLLSALKAKAVPYTPHSIALAVRNTALPVAAAEPFSQGPGLVQVDRAFEYLLKFAAATQDEPFLDVTIPRRRQARGIYLREPWESRHPLAVSVRVQPKFKKKAAKRSRTGFQLRVRLESTEPWADVGSHLLLSSAGQRFEVLVRPESLSEGVHYAEIRGFDAARPGRGPIFRLPITVIRPRETHDAAQAISETIDFHPGQVARRFVAVPHGATWADLRLQLIDSDRPRRFMLHTVERPRGVSLHDNQPRKFLTLHPGRAAVESFPVEAGRTLEVCLAQYWSSLGASHVQCHLAFHGLEPSDETLVIGPGEAPAPVSVTATLRQERLRPVALLDKSRQTLRPSAATIRPKSIARDRLWDERPMYELVLEYQFEQSKAGAVTPRFPRIDGLLYDSSFASELWMLFDANKRRVAADDGWSRAVRLHKGSYTLRVALRHSDPVKLETAKQMILQLDRPLDKPLKLSVYRSSADARERRQPISSASLEAGETVTFYVAAPKTGAIPNSIPAADVLLGTIAYGDSDSPRSGAGRRPDGFPLRCVVSPRPTPKKDSDQPATADNKPAKSLEDRMFDFRIEQLRKLPPGDDQRFDKLSEELLAQRPGDLSVLVARLERLDQRDRRKQNLPRIIAAADAVVAAVDRDKLAADYGTNVNPDDAEAVARRRQMDQERDILTGALYRKGRALAYMELPEITAKQPIEDPAAHDLAFENNFAQLARWVDTTDEKYSLLHIRRDWRRGQYGKALKQLEQRMRHRIPDPKHIKKRRDLYEDLGWDHAANYESKWLILRFPKHFEAF